MPKEYELKRNVLSSNRIRKLCKKLLQEVDEDKTRALEAYEFFKDLAQEREGEEGANIPGDREAKKCMVDVLKIAQTSKSDAIKLIGMLMKFESNSTANKTQKKGEGYSFFDELEDSVDELGDD